ncbi:MAG TPA: RluA family pseudouridine synthase [Pyrinomonadaceae bacterium]|nr:RluA family pseudouridine synthase [Pyrinomonadaceae bacterium]
MSEQSETINFQVAQTDAGKRLDAFLAENIEGWSRARLRRLIDDGDVLVNEKAAKPSYKLRHGDEIEAELVVLPTARFEPENIPLDIVYEDEFLAVINKPAGMVVHPGAGVTNGTLANALAFHFGFRNSDLEFGNEDDEQSKIQDLKSRIGLVHRLDKDTSGLIVVAKNENVHEALAEQFQTREVFKSYVALVHGAVRENSGRIDKPIARDRWKRTKMTVAASGRNALSLWKVRRRHEKFTLVDVEIKTGRTHQIRVHLASINHPIVGDETYNEGRDKTVANPEIKKAIQDMGRFFLHAERLSFTHPETRERLQFVSPLALQLENFLTKLESQ